MEECFTVNVPFFDLAPEVLSNEELTTAADMWLVFIAHNPEFVVFIIIQYVHTISVSVSLCLSHSPSPVGVLGYCAISCELA